MDLEGDRHVLYHSNALSYEFFQMIQHLFGEGKRVLLHLRRWNNHVT